MINQSYLRRTLEDVLQYLQDTEIDDDENWRLACTNMSLKMSVRELLKELSVYECPYAEALKKAMQP